jgi:hypothetical protein
METEHDERVRQRAYAIWMSEGQPEGGAERHWEQAEAEVRAQGTAAHPGDDAAPGAPGTGEDVCPACKGSGEVEGRPCPECGGTGKVIKGVGGG